ncbi:DUF1707 domain-containing protein [Nocardiopsis sediminis]|uniref:DUF1707 domain-containing protein n=1 Tax=Nocardiopsis sediminis TaxID=1778267 RepID=A0ABV8FV00_9ACTN
MDGERVPPEQMRASDADRDACAERLARALQEGRLKLDEYHERLDLAVHATTMGDLAALTRDLPVPPPAPVPAAVPEAADPGADPEWRDRFEPWRGLAAVSVILIAIWAVTSLISRTYLPFWPLIPLGFMFLFTLASTIATPPHDPTGRDRHLGHGDPDGV